MNKEYTLTTIQDEAVPLAASAAGGNPLLTSLAVIGAVAVLVVIAVVLLYRYLEQCRELRRRHADLDGQKLSDAGWMHRYSRKWLTDLLYEKETQMGGAAFVESRTWKPGRTMRKAAATGQKI